MTVKLDDYLLYKRDLPNVKERFRAFWEREIIDRVCISVTAPAEKQAPLPQPADETEYPLPWLANTNPDYVVRLYNATMSNTYYGGEALPVANAPGNLLYAGWGGKATLANGNVWVDPDIHNCEDWEGYRFDQDNQFVQDVLRITAALAEDAPGKYMVGFPGVFGPLDAMSMIRGMEDLIVELTLAECADSIRKAREEALRGSRYITQEIYKLLETRDGGYAVFPGYWSPGRLTYFSEDISCMMGPRQVRQWLLPEIQEMAGLCEFTMYHLDGPDAARHLPMILEIDEITGIQYNRGPRQTLAEAMPVYKQIQQAGKVQYIVECTYDEVETVLRELDPRGLLIFTSAPSVEAADSLLKNAERWSIKKR